MKVVSNRGRVVDMAALAAQNETTLAVTGGGVRMNARGDIIGPRGTVVQTREEIAQAYHQSSPNAVKNVSLKDLDGEIFQSPMEAVAAIEKTVKDAKAPKRKIEDSE